MLMNDALFGTYITETFSDIFTSEADFVNFVMESPTIPAKISQRSTATLFWLLYARYGENHIINTNINLFKQKVLATIFMYGPTWEKRLQIQEELRGLEDLTEGSTATYNSALNPGYLQDIDSQATQKINAQNKTIYKKTKMEGYANLMALLEKDVTEEFLRKFRHLFNPIVAPAGKLVYATTPEEQEILYT